MEDIGPRKPEPPLPEDTRQGQVVGGVGQDPQGIAVNPVTGTVYVANFDSGTVSLISATANRVTSTMTVGKGPAGVAVDPLIATAYVTCIDSYTVSVITN